MTGSTKYGFAERVTSSVFMRNLVLAILTALAAPAQTSSTDWAVHAANHYRVIPNVTYLTASNVELKLDVYLLKGEKFGASTPCWITVFHSPRSSKGLHLTASDVI